MNFQPLSDEEIKAQRGTIEAGECDFQVLKSEEKTSKNGNPMIEIQMKLWDEKGNEGFIYDYLLGTPNSIWKLKAFCSAIGEHALYDSGNISQGDFLGKSGRVMIRMKEDAEKKYAPKPEVHFYIEAKTKGSKSISDFDDIPF